MDDALLLLGAYAYVNELNSQKGGAVVSWKNFIKGKRKLSGETNVQKLQRLSNLYHSQQNTDRVVDELKVLQDKMEEMINKISSGVAVPSHAVLETVHQAVNIPPPPPPPMPMPQKKLASKDELEAMKKQGDLGKLKNAMIEELQQRLAKRGVIG